MNTGLQHIRLHRYQSSNLVEDDDVVAVEEPLAIQIDNGNGTITSLSVTMRTPGNDDELAVGFLFTEGIIRSREQVQGVKKVDENTVTVELVKGTSLELNKTDRNFYMTSSCGVCGKSSIDSITTNSCFDIDSSDQFNVTEEDIFSMMKAIDANQSLFSQTGGIHASALFSRREMLFLKEDVGRHNALDKLVGRAFLDSKLPLNNSVLFLSGRASFELIQKAAMAAIPVVCAVGAPSSLAVNLAKERRQTLIGFLKRDRFNVYSGHERITC